MNAFLGNFACIFIDFFWYLFIFEQREHSVRKGKKRFHFTVIYDSKSMESESLTIRDCLNKLHTHKNIPRDF